MLVVLYEFIGWIFYSSERCRNDFKNLTLLDRIRQLASKCKILDIISKSFRWLLSKSAH